MKKILKFTFPEAYFHSTRIKGKTQKISWYLVYLAPILFFLIEQQSKINEILFPCIILIILTNYIYENGYIENDLITTKKEKNPTIRLEKKELLWGRENLKKIFAIRLLLTIILTTFLFTQKEKLHLPICISSLIAIQLLYLIYNRTRSINNLIIILPLSFLRFFTPIISLNLFTPSVNLITSLIILYPLCKTIEFSKLKRFKLNVISKFIGKVDNFRIVYYLFATIAIYLLTSTRNPIVFPLYTSLYYLIYRISGRILITNKKFEQTIASNSSQDYRK